MDNTETKKKFGQHEYHKKWASTKAQISFRLSPEVKAEIDTHIKKTGEPLIKFILRAINETMQRDKEKTAR